MLKFMQSRNDTIVEHSKTGIKPDADKLTRPAPVHQTTNTEAAAPVEKPVPVEEGNKLIVGPNIKLKGSEITDCEILVVEGRVEASMKSRHIRIAQSGVFSGKAEIDVAEIRGHFEGELIVHKRLIIYATGSVTGQIRYGSMTVEEGAVITGNLEAIAANSTQGKPVEAIAATADAGSPSQDSVTRLTQAYPATLLSRHMASKRQS
ncbi:MAG: polymer-forming cytoskeletal protein [Sulfuriferula sp.]|nr:polymer-forming cytoskeletal protein [Sulfuriferula sp.]